MHSASIRSRDLFNACTKHVCWISLQSDQNLRGPHVARQQQLSVDICCPRTRSATNPPQAAAAAVDRRDRQTDGRTDRRTLDRLLHGLRNKESVGRDDRLIIELSFDLSENVYAMPINRLSARVPRRNRRRGRGERPIAREASRPCDCADTGGVRIADGRTPIRDD